MRKFIVALLGGLMVCGICSPVADAMKPFKKAFEEKYVQPANDPVFTKAFNTVSCNICHVYAQEKSARNEYGEALAKLISGSAAQRLKKAGPSGKAAETKKLLDELNNAFTKIEATKSATGPTYGELLKQHKLPAQ